MTLSDRPAPGPQGADAAALRVVVGAALLDGRGQVLAARRSAPEALAGRWEFPGGKVEPGETVPAALERELREELGVAARALSRLPGAWEVRPGLELHIWSARLLDGEPEPLQDHDALRWLTADELDTVDWLPQDRFALPHVRRLLAGDVETDRTPRSHPTPQP
ncbi:(deoxy)nucleoside triphosphate pyrophosphohydrolase [Streptacidiphilus fuscans]|uniref:8-oxo-dGTP diphosphatase n=1 Tax=Streptacidiphilus fuscans TaxID=2789292 RepID=A0A931B2C8_9ACTN|nr:(deoxy)nucleoside triphosphate pyrophosphohydrolase [Streptacidiphilus fuscans]MBF9067681.1 (deoxy)nucleoside triphosphate pyrophosphohydrolase [Streptacidiphilus fuscans]